MTTTGKPAPKTINTFRSIFTCTENLSCCAATATSFCRYVSSDVLPICQFWRFADVSVLTFCRCVSSDVLPICQFWHFAVVSVLTLCRCVSYDALPVCQFWRFADVSSLAFCRCVSSVVLPLRHSVSLYVLTLQLVLLDRRPLESFVVLLDTDWDGTTKHSCSCASCYYLGLEIELCRRITYITLTAELQRRIRAVEMRCYRKILRMSCKDHLTNGEVCAKIQQTVGPHEDLLTVVKRRKLKCYRQVSRSLGLANTILQGTVKGGRRQGRRKKRWKDNIREWTGLEFAKSQRAVENREKWRKLVVKSSVVPQRPPRLKDRWRWRLHWDHALMQNLCCCRVYHLMNYWSSMFSVIEWNLICPPFHGRKDLKEQPLTRSMKCNRGCPIQNPHSLVDISNGVWAIQ